ncbi:fasciclin-like arabinogalactan protein 3 [Phragmites australis]|uniref:fasciclin-like arabinogalactan protein 3 n=1 Tax=Phragmites australis TaxID=29695 RepID=UPI002D773CF4|nr:fasciclin-like arabinogalactan protein 3 [Phragmites australis]
MAPTKLPFLLLLALLLLPASGLAAGFGASAFNITKILAAFPEFSVFNTMLTDTSLAFAINSREKVTVLAPNNTAISAVFRSVPRIPRSFLADLLSLHVVTDYLDEPRLAALQRGRRGDGSVVTTLLQTIRPPPRGAGFLRVASGAGNCTTFSSAAPGGPRNATFERQVLVQPPSVSVLQVSGFVVPPGIRFPQPFPPRARHMAAPPPRQAPAPAPGPQPPLSGYGPLVPTPIKPFPTPNLTDTPPPVPEEETGVIPIPSVHGGMAAKLPSAAGHGPASWWSGLAVALGITSWLLGRL